MTEPLRKDFEAVALVLAVKHYRHANSEAALRTLFERRTDGTYSIDWVDGAWIGYQAGLEAQPVISIAPLDLPGFLGRIKAMTEKVSLQVDPRRFMVVLPEGGSMWDDEPKEIKRSDAVAAIEAAGGTVKVKP